MEKIKNFSYGRRNDDPKFEHHWEEVDIGKFEVTRPLILVLGGSGTLHNEQSNGNLKIVESFLGVFKQDADMIGVTYNYTFSNEELSASINELVSNLFVPILKKDEKRLPLKAALKNMRNITIFAHCYGDFKILTMILDKLNSEMSKLGYSSDEIKNITKQIFAVSYGANPSLKTDRNIKTFTVISASDEYWLEADMDWYRMLDVDDVEISEQDKQKIKNLPKYQDGDTKFSKFYQENERCFIFRQSENDIRVATGMLHKEDEEDHSFNELRREKNWEISEKASRTGDYVSRCLSCALCYSVANSILNNYSKNFIEINMSDLQAELESVVKPLNFNEPEIIL